SGAPLDELGEVEQFELSTEVVAVHYDEGPPEVSLHAGDSFDDDPITGVRPASEPVPRAISHDEQAHRPRVVAVPPGGEPVETTDVADTPAGVDAPGGDSGGAVEMFGAHETTDVSGPGELPNVAAAGLPEPLPTATAIARDPHDARAASESLD